MSARADTQVGPYEDGDGMTSVVIDDVVGREAVVTRSGDRPRALRLMVGDHCQIDVE